MKLITKWWFSDTRHRHAALHYRVMGGSWRRCAAFHQRGVLPEHAGAGPPGPDAEKPTRPSGACGQYVRAGQGAEYLKQSARESIFVYNSNPAVVAPNHNEVVRGFMRQDLFTVVHEQFFTDTTTYADIVLPATTFLEHKDLNKAYGHTYLQVSNQAIAPLGESRSNTDIFRELAQRMGFTDDCFQQSTDDVIDATLTKPENQQMPKGWERWMEGITRERLEKEGHVRLNMGEGPFLPFAKGGFATPSGKAELYSASLAAQGMDPVVSLSLLKNRACRGEQKTFRWSCWRAKPTTFSTVHLPTSRPCRKWSSRSCWKSVPRTPSAGIFMKATGCGSSTVGEK